MESYENNKWFITSAALAMVVNKMFIFVVMNWV